MSIDADWSVPEERGFTWWAHQHSQRMWAEPAFDDDGILVYRLRAETDVVRNVDIDGPVLALINAFNGMAVTSALIAYRSDRTIRYAASMWVHEGTVEWAAPLFSLVASMQAAHAQAQGELLAESLGSGRPAVTAHPTSGARRTPDDMLGIMAGVVSVGSEASWWADPEMETASATLAQASFTVSATGDELRLAAEFPHPRGTSLLRVDAGERHPALGSGMLVRPYLPEHVKEGEGPSWAAEMNRRELNGVVRTHGLGAWVVADETPTFVTFWPNLAKHRGGGDLLDVLFASVGRARWVAEDLRGDDWSMPGRIEQAQG